MFRCFLPQYGSCCLIRHPKPLGYVLTPLRWCYYLPLFPQLLFTLPNMTLASELLMSVKALTETVTIIQMNRSW